ncbi:MAG: hypothetical protein ACRDD7_13735, partial [Peptostreptococcaceae bacterium]
QKEKVVTEDFSDYLLSNSQLISKKEAESLKTLHPHITIKIKEIEEGIVELYYCNAYSGAAGVEQFNLVKKVVRTISTVKDVSEELIKTDLIEEVEHLDPDGDVKYVEPVRSLVTDEEWKKIRGQNNMYWRLYPQETSLKEDHPCVYE